MVTSCVEMGFPGTQGAELPDLSPFRVVVDAMRGIPAQLIDSGPFVSVQRPGVPYLLTISSPDNIRIV